MGMLCFACLSILNIVASMSIENSKLNSWCPFTTPYNKSMLKIGYKNCEDVLDNSAYSRTFDISIYSSIYLIFVCNYIDRRIHILNLVERSISQ